MIYFVKVFLVSLLTDIQHFFLLLLFWVLFPALWMIVGSMAVLCSPQISSFFFWKGNLLFPGSKSLVTVFLFKGNPFCIIQFFKLNNPTWLDYNNILVPRLLFLCGSCNYIFLACIWFQLRWNWEGMMNHHNWFLYIICFLRNIKSYIQGVFEHLLLLVVEYILIFSIKHEYFIFIQ